MSTATPTPLIPRLAYGLLLLLGLFTGLAALRYGLPGQPFAPPLHNLMAQRELLVLHAVAGGVALILGGWQLSTRLRQRRPRLHRLMGWGYATSILVGGITSLPLAAQADGGPVAQVGFGLLGVLWLASTAMALVHIRARRITAHQRWMLRSFALTAGGITLRLQIGVGSALAVPIQDYYTALAWTSWLPQALLLEWWLRRRTPGVNAHDAWAETRLGA